MPYIVGLCDNLVDENSYFSPKSITMYIIKYSTIIKISKLFKRQLKVSVLLKVEYTQFLDYNINSISIIYL